MTEIGLLMGEATFSTHAVSLIVIVPLISGGKVGVPHGLLPLDVRAGQVEQAGQVESSRDLVWEVGELLGVCSTPVRVVLTKRGRVRPRPLWCVLHSRAPGARCCTDERRAAGTLCLSLELQD